jgi:RHS repeat-associated protein
LDQIDSNADGIVDQQTLTQYLNDPENFTGYSQVLRETHSDPTTGQVSKVIDYTFGVQGIAQTVTSYGNGQVTSRVTNLFGHDGHGSVRVLTDMAAAISQLYLFDAYGNMLAIYNGARQFVSSNAVNALTDDLYAGEQFDPQISMDYLRCRYYDPATGSFTELDQFFGSAPDPQSFNKYLYAGSDPVIRVDPSGSKWNFDQKLGYAAHALFSGYVVALRLLGETDAVPLLDLNAKTVATALGYGRIFRRDPNNGGALSPDAVDFDHREFFELKPVSETGQAAGAAQIADYTARMGPRPLRFTPGNQNTLAPEEEKTPIGTVTDRRGKKYLLMIEPSTITPGLVLYYPRDLPEGEVPEYAPAPSFSIGLKTVAREMAQNSVRLFENDYREVLKERLHVEDQLDWGRTVSNVIFVSPFALAAVWSIAVLVSSFRVPV